MLERRGPMQLVTYEERLLVKRHRGTMPVILTCPHDGGERPANVPERTRAQTPASCDFEASRDLEAATITAAVAQRILEETALSPYVVLAKFHRRYVDANREARCAFTDLGAQPFYGEYHSHIDGYVREILEQNDGRGFLFDIHGTRVIDTDPADVYLGTADGRSLPSSFDRNDLFKQHGLHGLLAAARHLTGGPGVDPVFAYRVSPIDAATPETRQVSGGFTVRYYGARISSVQIEVANTLRADVASRALFIEDLAFAIVNFVRRHAVF
jgi:hypothetical protein